MDDAVSLLTEIARSACDYWAESGYVFCRYCDDEMYNYAPVVEHKDDCIYVRIQQITGVS